MLYSIHVRRKTGEWQTELVIWQGNKPKRDEEIEANLDGRIITVRVMNVTENPSNARGELGSPPIANTIGRFVVAAFAANAAGVPLIAAIRVTFRRTKSADKVGNRW